MHLQCEAVIKLRVYTIFEEQISSPHPPGAGQRRVGGLAVPCGHVQRQVVSRLLPTSGTNAVKGRTILPETEHRREPDEWRHSAGPYAWVVSSPGRLLVCMGVQPVLFTPGTSTQVLRQLGLPLRGVWALTSSELPWAVPDGPT